MIQNNFQEAMRVYSRDRYPINGQTHNGFYRIVLSENDPGSWICTKIPQGYFLKYSKILFKEFWIEAKVQITLHRKQNHVIRVLQEASVRV